MTEKLKMRSRVLGFFIIGFILLLEACGSRQAIPNQRALDPSNNYVTALKRSTKQIEFSDELSVHGTLTATLLDPRFRTAFEQEYREVYGPSAPDPKLLLPGLTLIFGIATDERNLHNLEGLNKLWSITYADGTTGEVRPSMLEKLDRDPLFMRYFFPYWNPWRHMYRIEFPLDASTASGTLHLRGVAGNIRLTW